MTEDLWNLRWSSFEYRTANLRMKCTWHTSCKLGTHNFSCQSYYSHIIVLNISSFSATHMSTVFTVMAHFLDIGPSLSASRSFLFRHFFRTWNMTKVTWKCPISECNQEHWLSSASRISAQTSRKLWTWMRHTHVCCVQLCVHWRVNIHTLITRVNLRVTLEY